MTSRAAIRWPTLLICAAILVPVVQLFVGVPMVGSHQAHDGRFAVATLEQFEAELAAGNMVPRWAFTGHGGLGSPIFFFYPPGAYFIAALLGFSLPGLTTATIIGIAQGRGYLLGLEVVDPATGQVSHELAARVAAACMARGVCVSLAGSAVRVSPMLVTSQEVALRAFAIVEQAIADVESELA